MIVTEQGKIIDFTCEAGAYTFDSKSEPSMLNGNFSEGLRESFRKVGKRFTFWRRYRKRPAHLLY